MEPHLNSRSLAARLRGLRRSGSASLSRAQASARLTNAAETSAEQLATENELKNDHLKVMEGIVLKASDVAATASMEAGAALKEVRADAQAVAAETQRLTVEAVQAMLANKYRNLAGWQGEVLTDPAAEAAQAVAKATQPYKQLVRTLYERVATYQTQENSLMSQANAMMTDAKAYRDAAKAKTNAGDSLGASRDTERATIVEAQGQRLAMTAQKYQEYVAHTKAMIQEYLNAEYQAAAHMQHLSNPYGLPAAPFDLSSAYTLPPPQ